MLLASGITQAQQQERTLSERIENPDRTLAYDLRKSSFGATGYSVKTARVKEFHGGKSFTSKSFLTRIFGRTKSHTVQEFDTSAANTDGKYVVPNLNTDASTKAMAVQTARESSKEYGATGYGDLKPGIMRAKAQGSLDAQYKQPEMSIDEVRTLLNKN